MKIAGIREPGSPDKQTILRNAGRYHIPLGDLFIIDTTFMQYLYSLETKTNGNQVKNHYQPLQALYYNRRGELQSFYVNCYAGGFPNLDWDKNSNLTTFPPLTMAPIDSLINIDSLLLFLKPLPETLTVNRRDYDHFVFIFWNSIMGRQNKIFIRIMQENFKLADQSKAKMIYVNTDYM